MTTNTTEDQPMTKDAAMTRFKALVTRYGVQWTAAVPREAYAQLAECNRVLSVRYRREALGLHPWPSKARTKP